MWFERTLIVGFMTGVLLVCIGVLTLCSAAQTSAPEWQQQVRKFAEQHDWHSAMQIVENEIAKSPQDMDVRSWRARILAWSGRLTEAEEEYLRILAADSRDPDNWMGLALVYSRENRKQEALQAMDRAVALDPKRGDMHVARGRILRDLNRPHEARAEFEETLVLEPRNDEARLGLASLRKESKHELVLETNTDLFSFAGANQQEGVSLISHWTEKLETAVGGSFYRWDGVDAAKIKASVGGKFPHIGLVTVGGAEAHDGGVIPQNEAFFAYDNGWKLSNQGAWRGLEINYEQHWYWYSTAQILALNETTIAYFPHEWTWSLRVTGARSQFPGSGSEWRPAGLSKLGFPVKRFENRQLAGNIFFATGTENYSQLDQIGHFSSHTYGGGLRFQTASNQDVSGFASYQQRTRGLTETSFGLAYGIRF